MGLLRRNIHDVVSVKKEFPRSLLFLQLPSVEKQKKRPRGIYLLQVVWLPNKQSKILPNLLFPTVPSFLKRMVDLVSFFTETTMSPCLDAF